jgi:hypothetical protein
MPIGFACTRLLVYDHLTKTDNDPDYKRVWRAKVLEKIRIFMWLVEQNAILTKDNMLRKNWHGDPSCYFCDSPETVDHLFFECPIAKVVGVGVIAACFDQGCRTTSYAQYWAWIPIALPGGEKVYMVGLAAICWVIWKGRNRVCFEKKQWRNPGELVYSTCAFLWYWAGLQAEDMQQLIVSGVDLVMRTAMKLLGKKSGPKTQLTIRDAAQDEEDGNADGDGQFQTR